MNSIEAQAQFNMSGLTVSIEAPNGVKVDLPTGLFINNEFVKGSAGEKLTSSDPA
jgi:aldehyde dehydrogenase (NAD(P)+)